MAPCDPDSVSASEKLHLFTPLAEVLIDVLLEGRQGSVEYHTLLYRSCLELYRVHGMLTDVAETLNVKARDQRASLEGAERDMPIVGLRGAVYLLQLFMLGCRGHWGEKGGRGAAAVPEEGEDDTAARDWLSCPRCREVGYRYTLWAVQHAVLSCQRMLEAESAAPRRWGNGSTRTSRGGPHEGRDEEEGAEEEEDSLTVSLKTLLIILMDLCQLCSSQRLERVKPSKAQEEEAARLTTAERPEALESTAMEDDRHDTSGCRTCASISKIAAAKAKSKAAARRSLDDAAASNSKLVRPRGRDRGSGVSSSETAGLPLATAFLAQVDGKFRALVEETLDQSMGGDEALLELRAAAMDLVRVVVRLCPADSLEGDEIFAFVEPAWGGEGEGEGGEPPEKVPSPQVLTRGPEKPLSLEVSYRGLPSFIDRLMSELGQGLVRGLPLRLVQSHLELFETLLSRLPPPPGDDPLHLDRYNRWRGQVAQSLLGMLVRTCISQSMVVRRFLHLALLVCPVTPAMQYSGDLMKAALRYFHSWLREQRSGGEVITAAEARSQLDEEGDDELYGEGSSSGQEEEEDDEDDGSDGGEEGGGVSDRHKTPKKKSPEPSAAQQLRSSVSSMRFASVACWQAAVSVVLSRWEYLLSQPGLGTLQREGVPQREIVAVYQAIMEQVLGFFAPVDLGGRQRKHKAAASLLPTPLKLRLLGVLSRMYSSCRASSLKVASTLRGMSKGEVPGRGAEPSPRSQHKEGDEDEAEGERERDGVEGATGAGLGNQEDASLVLAFVQAGHRLTGPVQEWVAVERQRPKQETGLLKRFPPLIFAVERLEMALRKVMLQVRTVSRDRFALTLDPGHTPTPECRP